MNDVTITGAQYAALTAVLELDRNLWYDIAESLSCTEIEVIVDLLREFGEDPKVCEQIIAAHAEQDDEGDEHWSEEEVEGNG